jgi:hypothetical protein
MKVPEKVGGSVELRQLGGGDVSNTSAGARAGVTSLQVKDRVSPGLLADAHAKATVRRDERLAQLGRSIADGSYRPDAGATADGIASDGRLLAALRAAWAV